jgi:hypothetical protein
LSPGTRKRPDSAPLRRAVRGTICWAECEVTGGCPEKRQKRAPS